MRAAVVLTVCVAAMSGCHRSEPATLPESYLAPGAQTDPLVPNPMDWMIMLRGRPLPSEYGATSFEIHRISELKVQSQSQSGASGQFASVLTFRYAHPEGNRPLAMTVEVVWTTGNVRWGLDPSGVKFVIDADYRVKGLRVLSAVALGGVCSLRIDVA